MTDCLWHNIAMKRILFKKEPYVDPYGKSHNELRTVFKIIFYPTYVISKTNFILELRLGHKYAENYLKGILWYGFIGAMTLYLLILLPIQSCTSWCPPDSWCGAGEEDPEAAEEAWRAREGVQW